MTKEADTKLAAQHRIFKERGKGAVTPAIDYDEASLVFGLRDDSTKAPPAPDALKTPSLDVEPTGAFSGRTAAESRAMALSRGQKLGVSLFAAQIKGKWCVVKTERGVTTYVEG